MCTKLMQKFLKLNNDCDNAYNISKINEYLSIKIKS